MSQRFYVVVASTRYQRPGEEFLSQSFARRSNADRLARLMAAAGYTVTIVRVGA